MAQEIAFPVGRSAKPPVTRAEIRKRTLRLRDAMVGQIRILQTSCKPRPEPKTLFEDVFKGAPAKDETLFAAIVAAASDLNTPPQFVAAFVNWLHAQLLAARGQRPLLTHATAWLHDTEAEGAANVAEQKFTNAVNRGDTAEVDRIITAKAAQVAAGYDLLQLMVATRDEMKVRA